MVRKTVVYKGCDRIGDAAEGDTICRNLLAGSGFVIPDVMLDTPEAVSAWIAGHYLVARVDLPENPCADNMILDSLKWTWEMRAALGRAIITVSGGRVIVAVPVCQRPSPMSF